MVYSAGRAAGTGPRLSVCSASSIADGGACAKAKDSVKSAAGQLGRRGAGRLLGAATAPPPRPTRLVCSSSPPASTASRAHAVQLLISAASRLAAAAGAHLYARGAASAVARSELTRPRTRRDFPPAQKNPAQVRHPRRHDAVQEEPQEEPEKKKPPRRREAPAPCSSHAAELRVTATSADQRFVEIRQVAEICKITGSAADPEGAPQDPAGPAAVQDDARQEPGDRALKLCMKYQPEDKAAKADRLKAIAEGGKKDDKAPYVKFGLNRHLSD